MLVGEMEPCCGAPAGRYRTDSQLLVAGAPGARMRALQWRAGTTLSIRTPPLTGPPKVPDDPPFPYPCQFCHSSPEALSSLL